MLHDKNTQSKFNSPEDPASEKVEITSFTFEHKLLVRMSASQSKYRINYEADLHL